MVIIMKLHTKFLGEVDIKEEQFVTFEQGLPAFEEEKQFVVLPFGEDTQFMTLQSVQTKDCAFVIVDPFQFYKEYKVKLPEAMIEQLEIEEEQDVAIFVLLTVQDPFTNTTANLQGPIVINMKKQKGKQLVMADSGYETKHRLFPEAAVKEEK